MSLANTADTYGTVTKTLHWLTVLLIFTVIPLGIIAHGMPYETSDQLAQKALLFSLHKTVGVTIFFVALARIVWAGAQPKPGLLNADKPVERILAQTIHWTLYGSLVLVPMTGWIHHAATTGFAPIWWPFGQDLPFVPKSESLAQTFAGLHVVFERVLVLSILLHVAGALKHHFVDKDSTLRRMLPGRTEVTAPKTPESLVPAGLAVSLFVAALGVGAGLGVFTKESTAAQVAELAEVETGWAVEQGTLGISVLQLGAAVEGSFADWTAAIDFAETPTDGTHGTVEVTIAIGSLTLGSVTGQALGPEYFDAETHPTAVFAADILPGAAPGQYLAQGTVTLKGATLPVTLNVDLTIDGDVATMTGETTMDRRDYDIGASQSEGNLGFDVGVTVALTATRVTP